MKERDGRRWTLLFIRRGTTESHSFELSEGKAVLLLSALLLTVAATFLAVGRWTQRTREATQIEQLETRVAVLTSENARVVELAARLADLEQTYARFQRVLGGASPVSDGRGPPVAATGQPDRPADARLVDGDPTLPHAWPIVEQGYITRQYGDGGHQGLDIAVKAVAHVKNEVPDIQLLIYGDGSQRWCLRRVGAGWLSSKAEVGVAVEEVLGFFLDLP